MTTDLSNGFVIAAPKSGSGKTTVTLGLLRAFRNAGFDVAAAKCGPDYIDPRFHEAACSRPCGNLDPFAMSPERMRSLAPRAGLVIVEGVMGLFDGARNASGSTADLARALGLPVVLVVDASSMAQSVGPLVNGFATHDPDIRISGIILNNVGSDRHEMILRDSIALPVLGAIRRNATLSRPARHLGLVQAREHGDLDQFMEDAAAIVSASVDLDSLVRAARPMPRGAAARLAPPAATIAVADDAAFGFSYPHMLADWESAGARVSRFSPLANEAPDADARFIFLPGGYPELHAARIAAADRFHDAMKDAVLSGRQVYGECGGYMVLGRYLTDADGNRHRMLGLLDLETSFAERRLHLGYRHLRCASGPMEGDWGGHEFHYATTVRAEGEPLFAASDGWGAALAPMGLVNGPVCGSFAHLIDRFRN